ncbi:MAG: FliG C-terminal domain-containing protein [Bdellovibrionota bacterium]
MSMISRYQKPGGFVQLLQLIETCGKAKQENFLNIIEKESPRWAVVIKQKMLSLEKIMSWDDNSLAEIFVRVNELTLATAMHGFKDQDWAKISKTFSHLQKRRIEDLKNSKQPTPPEISSAFVKVIEEVRAMIKDGHLRVDKFAPELFLEENIEDKISKGEVGGKVEGTITSTVSHSPVSTLTPEETDGTTLRFDMPNAGDSSELKELRLKVQALHKENVELKNELKMVKERIVQIKKLSA